MSDLLERAGEVFLEICDLPPAEQSARLQRLATEEPELHAEVEFLLDGDRSRHSNFEAPAYQSFAKDLSATKSQQLPERIGHYSVVRKIGEGGMGIVFEAEQEAPARRVALKLMRPMFGGDTAQRRFDYEVAVLGRLQHPGIAQIIEAGICDLGAGTQPFFAMEYVDGRRLGVWARQQNSKPRARLELLVKLCEATHHAHQRGVIHRDLKPDNILVTEDGQPKILDFGIARAVVGETTGNTMHTQTGEVMGTLRYMSPEQVRGHLDELDIRSDVYSLGVIGFEFLCGEMPYDLRDRSITESARIISEQDPPPLGTLVRGLRGDVETIVAKALEKDKNQRYQSAAEFGADIQRFLDDVPIVARPHTLVYELRKFAKRNRALVGGSLGTLIAIIGGSIGTVVFAMRASDQEQIAELNAYSLGVRAASDAVDDSKYRSARTFLDETPTQFRGWEWHYVDSRMEPWDRVLTADVRVVDPICYTPDGTRVISLLADGTVGVWDLSSGRLSRLFPGDTKISAIANKFPRDGPRLAAGAADGRIFLWDLSGREAPLVLPGHGQRISCLTWTSDGGLLAADPVSTRLWRDGRTVKTFAVQIRASSKNLCAELITSRNAGAFAYTGAQLACSTNLDTGATRVYRTASSPVCITYSPGGQQLVVGTEHQNLHILDAATFTRLDDDHGHTRRTDQLRYSPDGSLLAAAAADGTLTLREAESGRTLVVYACGRPIRGLAFRPDGRQIACADLEGNKVSLWNLPMDATTVFRDQGGNVHNLGWSPDGTLLYAGRSYPTGFTQVLDSMTGEVLARIDGCAPFAFDRSSQRLLVRGPGRYSAIDLAGGVQEHLPGDWKAAYVEFARRYGIFPGRQHRQHSVDPSARFGLEPGYQIEVIRLSDGEALAELADRHWVNHATAFSPDGLRLLSTGGDAILIYDVATWSQVGELPPGVHTRSIMGADFSPDGSRIVTACHDNLVRVFDAKTYKLVLELEGHTSHVACAVFSPDGRRIASAGGDATVRMWDSIPRARLSAEARAAAALRAELAQRIEKWFEELGDATRVAARLRSDVGLSPAQRSAALKILMARRRR